MGKVQIFSNIRYSDQLEKILTDILSKSGELQQSRRHLQELWILMIMRDNYLAKGAKT
jgi:hypothetical protein